MPIASTTAVKISSGSCPHGLPHGACPICSGMGGGSSVKREDKAKEMSYDECYAVWMQMKAQKLAQSQKNAQFSASFTGKTPLVALAQTFANAALKIGDFTAKLAENHPILAKPVNFIAKKILIP